MFEYEDRGFLPREYFAELTLSQHMYSKGALELDEALNIAERLCDILIELHRQSSWAVYPNLNPQNILIAPDGGVKLMDLTPCQAAKADPRGDIYALGMILLLMVTGQSYSGALETHVAHEGLKRLIAKCVATAPKRRFESVPVLKRALGQVRNGSKASPGKWLIRAAGCALAAGVVCAGIVFWPELERFVFVPLVAIAARRTQPAATASTADEPVIMESVITEPIITEPAAIAPASAAPKRPAPSPPAPKEAVPAPSAAPSTKFAFVDSTLEQAAKQAAGIDKEKDMTPDDVMNLVEVIQVIGNISFPDNSSLILNDMGGYDYYLDGTKILQRGSIASLEDLRRMHSLRELFLSFQHIEELEPISALQLIKLDLDNNYIGDISPLAGMTTLTELYLSSNPLDNIEALAKLTSLEKLDICATAVKDVSVIKNFPKLSVLLMRGCPVTRLLDLGNMESLEEASLAGVLLEDFAPIREHKGWKSLDLSFTRMENPLDIRYPSDLTFLNIGGTNLETLNGIENFTNLTELWVHNTDLSSLSGVEALNKLQKLHMHYTEIEDITPLASLTNLTELDVGYSAVKDLRPLLKNRKRPLRIICPGLPESVVAPMVGQPNIILDR